MGGKPSKGTKADKRLAGNKPKGGSGRPSAPKPRPRPPKK